MNDFVDSASDQRVVHHVMRHEDRVLSMEGIGQSRELSIAKTKTEDAVMWAVQHLTK